ncbi:MAG: hypothetical protein JOZ83_08840 [Silvibacterium sp.]|nr:hypothetical protein [Silvibacterium sp.]
MANNNVVISVPNPDSLPLRAQAFVGSTATWKCSTRKYPNYQLSFAELNPFNHRKNAKFSGSHAEPVSLPVRNRGTFKYNIKHIDAEGSARLTGPFALLCVGIAKDGIRKPPPPPRKGGIAKDGIRKPPPPPGNGS